MFALRTSIYVFFAMVLSAFGTVAYTQSPTTPSAAPASSLITSPVLDPAVRVPDSVANELWFGWIESQKQQLRTFLRIQRDAQGNAIAGWMLSPDETMSELAWNDFTINNNGEWKFTIASPVATQPGIQFNGTQSATGDVAGAINRGDETVALKLQKLQTVPSETRGNLGADAVWLGTVDLVVRKIEVRVRKYSKPPFASSESPRFLFDLLTQNVPGVPAELTIGADGKSTLEMKSIDAKFVGRINETGDEWEGRFTQGKLPLKLLLKLQSESTAAAAPAINKTMNPSQPVASQASEANSKLESAAKKDMASERIAELAAKAKRISTEFYDEMPFEVVLVKPKMKKVRETTSIDPGLKLSGTLTIPKQKEIDAPRSFPAVVMVSGTGPQDRDETIGRHKPFQAMAHFLAKNGIASLRYDDRGVGQSSGDYFNATTADFAKDALSVWEFAKTVAEIDAAKIGILGHSEGGLIGPMAAAWEPGVAFLILIAPPGLNGAEIMSTQIDRMSELQGMSPEDRKVTMALQERLQVIASSYITDESKMRSDVQSTLRQNWEGLKSIALAQDPKVDLELLRRGLSAQIESQLMQLQLPWYRFQMSYDPNPNWMLLRCPTLAMWGGNDVVVLPELNRDKLLSTVKRNPAIDVQFSILPGLNHLLQTSKTGLPEEYESIEESISPLATDLIRSWGIEHGLIEK